MQSSAFLSIYHLYTYVNKTVCFQPLHPGPQQKVCSKGLSLHPPKEGLDAGIAPLIGVQDFLYLLEELDNLLCVLLLRRSIVFVVIRNKLQTLIIGKTSKQSVG